ncbi:hypothetical protein [Rhizobium hidalgonense]|uniref:hypothetical protein n=1 Tax=Rhizobium hidalgonense TaxID=1538159 RepID=UPI002870F4AD|nr:hypothetical protein [Rhizobium hidalgonense]MDR9808769.1 hypothetical protein [Rhizobium hidalgonense]
MVWVKIICFLFGIVTLAIGGAWAAGVRVVVIQPIGAIPEGRTVLVTGLPGLNPIDSPDAICQRKQGGVSLLCRGITAGAIAENGHIIARLPYSRVLFRLSGAPDLQQ